MGGDQLGRIGGEVRMRGDRRTALAPQTQCPGAPPLVQLFELAETVRLHRAAAGLASAASTGGTVHHRDRRQRQRDRARQRQQERPERAYRESTGGPPHRAPGAGRLGGAPPHAGRASAREAHATARGASGRHAPARAVPLHPVSPGPRLLPRLHGRCPLIGRQTPRPAVVGAGGERPARVRRPPRGAAPHRTVGEARPDKGGGGGGRRADAIAVHALPGALRCVPAAQDWGGHGRSVIGGSPARDRQSPGCSAA